MPSPKTIFLARQSALAAAFIGLAAMSAGCEIEPMGHYHERSVTTVVPPRGYYGGYYDGYYGGRVRGGEQFVPYGQGYDPRTFYDRGNAGGRPYLGTGHDYACLPGRGCKKVEPDSDWGYKKRIREFDRRY